MVGKRIAFSRKRRKVTIDGVDQYIGDNGFIVHLDDLRGTSAADVKATLRSIIEINYFEPVLYTSSISYKGFDPDFAPPDPVVLELDHNNNLILRVDLLSTWYSDDPQSTNDRFRRLSQPLVNRVRAEFLSAEIDDRWASEPWMIHVRVKPQTRGASTEALISTGQELLALLRAFETGELDSRSASDLVRAGHAEALIGLPESQWLEVKSQEYNLKELGGRIALARAVARFANAENDGLLIIGMKTKKTVTGEILSAVAPIRRSPQLVKNYSRVLADHLYPPPDLMQIESIAYGAGEIVMISIPKQPEEHRPFLVHGAILGISGEGTFISIVRRRGEESIPITAPSIHATLAAGRALLRRGVVPGIDVGLGTRDE